MLGKAGVTLRNWAPLWGLIAFQLCLSRETSEERMKTGKTQLTQLSWPKPDLELIGLGARGRLWLKKQTRQSGLKFPFTGPAIEQGISPDSLFYFGLKKR